MIQPARRVAALPPYVFLELAQWRDDARARGVDVIQNRCPKIEYQRLFGELRMGGFATGVISSRL